jgi:hypothetical protein
MVNTRNTAVENGKGVARDNPDVAASDARGHALEQFQQEQLRQLHASTSGRVEELSETDEVEDGGSGTLYLLKRPGDASDPEEPAQRPSRGTPGRATAQDRAFTPAGLDSPRDDLGTPYPPGGGRDPPSFGGRQQGMTLPPALAVSTSASGYVQSLLEQLFMAEESGASAEDIARLERRVNLASKALMPVASSTERLRDPQDAASRLMRTLNNVNPRPKLGVDGRVPTPQQVH